MVAISGSLTVIASPRGPATQLEEIWDCIILILTELPGTTRRLSWGTASGSGHITQQQQAGRPGKATSEKQTICGPKDGSHMEFNANFFNGICIQNC